MAKKGRIYHLKRLATKKLLAIRGKKHKVFLTSPSPGPHPKKDSIALAVLLRDELGICADFTEARKLLKNSLVFVDGKIVKDPKRPIGLMDIIFVKPSNKYWRMEIIDKKLHAKELKNSNQVNFKYCKVIKKHTIKKGKISLTLHDSKTIIGDNKIMVGDTIKVSLPDVKLVKLLKLQPGAFCYIFRGKHAGTIGVLDKIIELKGSMASIAVLKDQNKAEIRTASNYIMVIDEEFSNG
ncbi:MAG: S4 domain-containing protein [Candidatus Anstonellaceae archaeon]